MTAVHPADAARGEHANARLMRNEHRGRHGRGTVLAPSDHIGQIPDADLAHAGVAAEEFEVFGVEADALAFVVQGEPLPALRT